jgi:hypothetical protein
VCSGRAISCQYTGPQLASLLLLQLARLHREVQECDVMARGMSSVPCLQTALPLQSAATRNKKQYSYTSTTQRCRAVSRRREHIVCSSDVLAQHFCKHYRSETIHRSRDLHVFVTSKFRSSTNIIGILHSSFPPFSHPSSLCSFSS